MNNNTNFDKIERYVFDQMTRAERQQFEEEIEQNVTLQQQVNLHAIEKEAMRLLDREQLTANFAAWDEEDQDVELEVEKTTAKVVPLKRRNSYKFLAIAASFALLLSLGFVWWSQMNYSSEALADNYFPTTSTADRSSVEGDDSMMTILDYLENGEYDNAINEAETLKNSVYREQAILLQAEAFHLKGDHENAINKYDALLDQNDDFDSSNVEKAEWMKAVTLLRSNKEMKARTLLNRIAENEEHSYQMEAVDLLKDLNSFWYKISWS